MASTILNGLLNLDYESVSTQIQHFISNYVGEAGADGAVIGLSGGIDSTVVAHLTVKALSSKKVLGLILPDSTVTPKADIEDAQDTAKRLGIKSQLIDITSIHNAFMKHLTAGKIPEGNLRARIRMCFLYYHANLDNRLVIGTGDRSEILIGYFTKYGDGGVDTLPIGGLYKTQVKMLAKHLDIPNKIIEKQSSPRLWSGHTAKDELGLPYETIDPILHLLFDLNIPPEEAANLLGNTESVGRILEMNSRSQHKRIMPNTCPIKQPTRTP